MKGISKKTRATTSTAESNRGWPRSLGVPAAALTIALYGLVTVGLGAVPAQAIMLPVCAWNGSVSTDLNDPANYTTTSGDCSTLAGAELVFPTTVPGNGSSLALSADLAVNDIVLNNSYTLGGAGFTLTFSSYTGQALDVTSGSSTISANVAVGAVVNLEAASGAAVEVTGFLSSPGNLNINENGGTGRFDLSANNSGLSGSLYVANGVLEVGANGGLGTTVLTVRAAGALALDGGVTAQNTLSNLSGTLESLRGSATWSGPVSIGFNGGETATLAAATGSTLDVSGPISPNWDNDVLVGPGSDWAGTVELSNGSNFWDGNTTVLNGTLRAGAAYAINESGALNVSAGATVDMNGYNLSINSVTGDPTGTITNSGAAATLGLTALSTDFTVSENLTGPISLSVFLNGSRTIGLAGTNSYTGSTYIWGGGTSGTLEVDNSSALGNTSGVSVGVSGDRENLALAGDVSIPSTIPITNLDGTLETVGDPGSTATWNGPVALDPTWGGAFAAASGATLDVPGAVSDNSGGLTVGSSAMTGTVELSSTSNPVIWTEITAGTLVLHGTLTGSVSIENGATLEGSGTVGQLDNFGAMIPGSATSPGAFVSTGVDLFGSTSTLSINIIGPTAGSGYSQFSSSNVVNLGGDLNVTSDSFVAPAGTTFDVVTGGSIRGTFANAPEGTVITVDGRDLKVSYTVDSVVLTDVTVTATAPDAPTLNSAVAGSGSVALTWTAPSSDGGSAITGYNIYEGTTSGGENYTTPVDTVGASATGDTILGLTNGTTYYFTVKAVNTIGASDASGEVSATPLGVPGAPTGLAVSKGKAAVITLSWTDHGWSINQHEVIVYQYMAPTKKNPTAVYTQVKDLPLGSVTSVVATGLLSQYTYVFKVNATNVAGTSPYSGYSGTFKG